MSKIAIKVENLSKAYQLGNIGTGTISRDIERWWAKMRGKEDPFLRIGEVNDKSKKSDSNIIWSLKNINFEIEQGDAVGIIGRNGAGKSTLLKILSKVTAPTTGIISGNGRIASLLEVGTGFQPELTGRENIYLNGAILGMRKREIDKKFDEIVDFSGVEKYIDTPVKRYSSGMYVRLAFAVAAHLESEILIVDEVLAVGDAEFQKKCLGKMREVSKGEGRTVLFVSHQIESIKSFCKNGILLENGLIAMKSDISNTISSYLNENVSLTNNYNSKNNIFFSKIALSENQITLGSDLKINMTVNNKFDINKLIVAININNQFDETIAQILNIDSESIKFYNANNDISIIIENINVTPNKYNLSFWVGYDMIHPIESLQNIISFEVINNEYTKRYTPFPQNTKCVYKSKWFV